MHHNLNKDRKPSTGNQFTRNLGGNEVDFRPTCVQDDSNDIRVDDDKTDNASARTGGNISLQQPNQYPRRDASGSSFRMGVRYYFIVRQNLFIGFAILTVSSLFLCCLLGLVVPKLHARANCPGLYKRLSIL